SLAVIGMHAVRPAELSEGAARRLALPPKSQQLTLRRWGVVACARVNLKLLVHSFGNDLDAAEPPVQKQARGLIGHDIPIAQLPFDRPERSLRVASAAREERHAAGFEGELLQNLVSGTPKR